MSSHNDSRPANKRILAMQKSQEINTLPSSAPRRKTARMSTGGKSPRARGISAKAKRAVLSEDESDDEVDVNVPSTPKRRRIVKASDFIDDEAEEDPEMPALQDVSDDEEEEEEDDDDIVVDDEGAEAAEIPTVPALEQMSPDLLKALLKKIMETPGAIEALASPSSAPVAAGAAAPVNKPAPSSSATPSKVPTLPVTPTLNSAKPPVGKTTVSQTPLPVPATPTAPPATPAVTAPKTPVTAPVLTATASSSAQPNGTVQAATTASPAIKPGDKGKKQEASPQTVYHEDLHPASDRFTEPAQCEVYDPAVQDPALREMYQNLPKLKRAEVVGFNGAPAANFFNFSDWPNKAPDLDSNALLSSLEFVQRPPYVNLARVHPSVLHANITPANRNSSAANKSRRVLYLSSEPAIALTPIYVTESQLAETPSEGNGPQTKFVAGFLHGQEYDRVMGCLGMVFREDKMYTNLYHSTVTFSTIPQASSNSPRKTRSSRTFYRGSGSGGSPGKKTYLLTNESVPVYDVAGYLQDHGKSFNLNDCIGAIGSATGEELDKAMHAFGAQRIESELDGACAVVAHSVNVSSYTKDNVAGQVLNFNVLFILVLGWDNEQSAAEDAN